MNGVAVPSCTTISSRFADKGGLIFWANSVGLGERDCDEQETCGHCGRKPGKRQSDVAKAAADVGNLGHALIEGRVHEGDELDEAAIAMQAKFSHLTEEQREMANNCLREFDRWFVGSGVSIIETELSLTSEKYRFGGTFDGIGHVAKRFALLDWKTSKGLYPDHLVQLGGYVILVEDQGFPRVEEIDLVRVSKETAAFEHRSFTRKTFQPAIDFFMQSLKLYEAEKDLKKLMR